MASFGQKRVAFQLDEDAGPSKRSHDDGENKDMDPETAKKLFENGAFLIMTGVPPGTEIGIDMHSWRSGGDFQGLKMIPPGLHFCYWSSVYNRENSVGPRTGFFHFFGQKEILAKKFNPTTESFEDILEIEEINRFKENLKNMDKCLGAYPYDGWKKWVSLTSKVTRETLSRLEPISGQIFSVTELLPTSKEDHEKEAEMSARCSTSEEREANLLPNMRANPKGVIRYTDIPKLKYPSGSTPEQITRYSMDSSYQLQTYLAQYEKLYGDQVSSSMSIRGPSLVEEILAELQFAFVCFLVGQNYDSFEQWKKLLIMLCTCEEAVIKHTQLYTNLITEMYFQIREVPNDFFVDIVSSNNFLVTILNQFFGFVRNNSSLDEKLRSKTDKFQAHLSQKFSWVFDDEEDEEDKPVIVET